MRRCRCQQGALPAALATMLAPPLHRRRSQGRHAVVTCCGHGRQIVGVAWGVAGAASCMRGVRSVLDSHAAPLMPSPAVALLRSMVTSTGACPGVTWAHNGSGVAYPGRTRCGVVCAASPERVRGGSDGADGEVAGEPRKCPAPAPAPPPPCTTTLHYHPVPMVGPVCSAWPCWVGG